MCEPILEVTIGQ